jgi:hypothetical protein
LQVGLLLIQQQKFVVLQRLPQPGCNPAMFGRIIAGSLGTQLLDRAGICYGLTRSRYPGSRRRHA